MKTEENNKQELPRLLCFREIKKLTGLSRSTVWKLEKSGEFPRRRLVTQNRVAWLESEIHAWIKSRNKVEDALIQPKHNLPQRAPSQATKSPSFSKPTTIQPTRPRWLESDDES